MTFDLFMFFTYPLSPMYPMLPPEIDGLSRYIYN